MRSTVASLFVAAGLGVSVPAWAADAPSQRGWFLEASVVEAESSNGEAPLTFRGEDTGLAIGGGYAFTKHLALQATYYDIGEHFNTDCPAAVCTAVPHEDLADIRALSVAAVGTWRVAPAVEVFGKLGALTSNAELQLAATDSDDSGALVGAGVGIWATPRLRINVQYERADHDLELESAGIGITYRF